MKENYSFFLFSQLYNVVHPNDPTPYDMLFEDLQKLHSDYEDSIYNDPDKGEYECMEEFLKACKDIIIKPAKEEGKVLLIDRGSFIDWFFDEDMKETFVYDYGVTSDLATEGKFDITAKALLDAVGYLPASVVSELQTEIYLNEDDEVDTDKYTEIKFAE
jgi:hypothetical protein